MIQVSSTFLGLTGWALLTFAFTSCNKATPPPLPPQPLTVSVIVNSPNGPKPIMGAEVVVVPYEEGRKALFNAMLKRRKTEDRLRAEETALEKHFTSNPAFGASTDDARSPGKEASAEQAFQGAKTTIGHLTDRALIYFEEVSQTKGTSVPPERLAAFREKLGVDEIKRFANLISAKDSDGTLSAIQGIRAILEREVYSGNTVVQARNLTLDTLKTLESSVRTLPAATPSSPTSKPGENLSKEEIRDRLVGIEITRIQEREPLRMFSALPSAKFKGTTDGSGRCSLTIPSEGRWLIGVGRQQDRGIVAEALGISKSDCWIQEIQTGVTQLNFTDDNALRPAVAPLGLEQSTSWK